MIDYHTFQILDQIFANLDIPTIKCVRLVDSNWADVGASHLGRRTSFQTRRVLLPPGELCPFFNPKLARRVQLSDQDGDWATPLNNLTSLAPAVDNYLTNLCLTMHHRCVSQLITILTESGFQHLKLVCMSVPDCHAIQAVLKPEEVDTELGDIPTFPERKLLTLSFMVSSANYPDVGEILPFRRLFQGLTNSAPKLKNMQIVDNFYPDLRTCRNLRRLEWAGWPAARMTLVRGGGLGDTFVYNGTGLDLNGLSRMVGQVKGSIKVLRIGQVDRAPADSTNIPLVSSFWKDNHFYCYKIELAIILLQKGQLLLPLLPQLARLMVQSPIYFPQVGEALNAKCLQNLRCLLLSGLVGGTPISDLRPYDNPAVENALAKITSPLPGIVAMSLTLHKGFNPDSIKRLTALTPNLRTLELVLFSPNNNEIKTKPYFFQRIYSVSGWKLVKLTIRMKTLCGLRQVIHRLKSIGKLRGLFAFV